MSTRFEVEARFAQPPDRVVQAVLDAQLQQKLYTELRYLVWNEEKRVEGDRLERRIRIVPPITLPAFVRKALGDSAGYREHQTWDPSRRAYRWHVEFDLSSRLSLSGDCVFDEDGDEGCRRRVVAEAKASIPLLSGKLEAFLRDETTRTQNDMTQALAGLLGG